MEHRRARAEMFAVALVLATACAPDGARESGPRPDVLLVSFDTLRADHTSAYGYARSTTPALERVAAEGVRFEVAYAPTATTAPSHASLLTGLSPRSHGVVDNGIPLATQHQTLPEILRAMGYRTAGFTSSFVLHRDFGFGQGFEVFDDEFGDPERPGRHTTPWHERPVPGGVFERRSDRTTNRALAWIESLRSLGLAPFFVWVHYIDPHEPYWPSPEAGDPFGARALPRDSLEQVIARYDTEISFADRELGRLLEGATAASGPGGLLTVVTADHGEGFLEHGWRSHAAQIYEEQLRIPLVLRWPGRLAPRIAHAPVSLDDVVPTLFGLLGAEAGTFEGDDHSPWLCDGTAPEPARPLFFARQHYERDGRVEPIPLRELGGKTFGDAVVVKGEKLAVRLGRWKYLEAPEEDPPQELYDILDDPHETRDRTADRPEVAERLAALLRGWRERRPAAAPAPPIPAEDRARLEALGYASPVPVEAPRLERLSPLGVQPGSPQLPMSDQGSQRMR